MTKSELKEFLDEKVELYNNPNFIESDPIQIPHQFSLKEDIEISGFLAATIAWGNRKMIINNSIKMMDLMGNSPYDFVMSHSENDLEKLENFVHRTFNGGDFSTFIKGLQNIYTNHNGLEAVFSKNIEGNSMQKSISEFKKTFFEINHQSRTQKHISDPVNNSAAKRINMFLRWMVRNDNKGVDFWHLENHSNIRIIVSVRRPFWKCCKKIGTSFKKTKRRKSTIRTRFKPS